jgi:signal transduction histidine kinase
LNTYHEFPAMTVDGYEIWLGQNVQIIQEGDKVIGFQAVARDITDLKRAQDALALARDQALEASKMKSQLLAKVSHELRTPLGGVLGYAELLHYDSFGELSAKQKQATGQIIESANYLNRMVGELLDEAQIEAKTMSLRQERFSPGEILQKVALTMSVLAQNKGLAFSSDLAEDLPAALYGDSQRLQQIMINLLGNAIKFTKTGEVCIKLTRPDKQFWAIQVVDTGAGIPQDAMNYIFEPFRQVNNAITRENRGTGLGLSITKQLVELMGGRISVESKVDQGSTFSIILPIRETLENAA